VNKQHETAFEYSSVRSVTNEAVCSLYHSPVSHGISALEEVGVFTRAELEISKRCDISPAVKFECPSPGLVNLEWCLSHANVQGVQKLRICKISKEDDSCLGVLLMYANGAQESLGQIRFDSFLSESCDIHVCHYKQEKVAKIPRITLCAKPCRHTASLKQPWLLFPGSGSILWWFGPNGNIISLV
jgi:hypothetical protein